MDKVSQAVELIKGARSCSQSVLCAFCDDAGISFEDAEKIAAPLIAKIFAEIIYARA